MGGWIGLATVCCMIAVGLAMGFTARRSYVGRKRPSRLLSMTTDRSAKEAHELILKLVEPGKYKLEEDHLDQGLLTLASNPTAFSWGFFLPIYIEASEGGQTKVTIGIESKFIQAGPVVTHHHKN